MTTGQIKKLITTAEKVCKDLTQVYRYYYGGYITLKEKDMQIITMLHTYRNSDPIREAIMHIIIDCPHVNAYEGIIPREIEKSVNNYIQYEEQKAFEQKMIEAKSSMTA